MEEQIQPVINQTEQTMESKSDTPRKGFPIKTLILIVLLAITAFGLSALAVFRPQFIENENTQAPLATPIPNPIQTTLTISSSPTKLSTPSSYITDVIINTGQDLVNKVQLEISYDPKILSNVNINPGPFFTNPQVFLKNIDQENGRITFALGVQDSEDGILGQGVIAELSFTAIQKNATTSVMLLPKSEVSADGFVQSVLKTTIDGQFIFSTKNSTTSAR